MKIRANRAELADAVSWVSQAVPKKPNMPALAGIKITAEAEAVSLHCFDYESSHAATVTCDVPSAGECLVSAHLLREILAALKGETVELTLDDSRLTIACGKSTYRLGVMRLDDYPSLPAMPNHVGKVARDDLAGLIGTVEHAVNRDPNPNLVSLTAVHLEADGLGALVAITTDRFQIARAETAYDGKPFVADVPAASLASALKGLSGPLDLGHDDGLIGLSDGSRTVTTRCLSEGFPSVGPLLALEPSITVETDAEAFASALRRAQLVDAGAALHVSFATDEISIASDPGENDAAEFIECEASEPIAVLVNGRMLADALLACGGRVRIGLSTPLKPLIITPADDRPVKAIVMPRRSVR